MVVLFFCILALNLTNVEANPKSCKPFLIAKSSSPQLKTHSSAKPIYHITGDNLEQTDKDNFYLKGQVKITSNNYILQSNELDFNRLNKTAKAFGKINLQQKNFIITAYKLRLNQRKQEIHVTNAMYQILPNRGFGEARKIDIYNKKKLSYLEDASYTTCPILSQVTLDDNNLYKKNYNHDVTWEMRFKRLHLDENKHKIYGYNVRLYLYQIPIFYIPYISATTKKRATGLLLPKIGVHNSINTNSPTAYWRQPYFFNLADNYDDTISLMKIQDRGSVIDNEFRYLNKTHKINFTISAINDALTKKNGIKYYLKDGTYETGDKVAQRWRVKLNAKQYWDQNWSSEIKWQEISDESLYSDIPLEDNLVTANQLERNIKLNYTKNTNNYQINNSLSVVKPLRLRRDSAYNYYQTPNLKINYQHSLFKQWQFLILADLTKFNLVKNLTNKPEGSRAYVKTQIKSRWDSPYSFSESKFSLYTLKYQIDNATTKEKDIVLPQISLRQGFIFERDLNVFNTNLSQTLTPELQWLYTPYQRQTTNPLFDTTDLDLKFSNIFYSNRFSGYDRIADSNYLTFAITTDIFDHEYKHSLKASVGQIAYITANKVALNSNKNNTSLSDYFTRVSFISQGWQLFNTSQWQLDSLNLKNTSNNLQSKPFKNLSFFINNQGNNLTEPTKKETIAIGALWRPLARWQLGSYIQYDYTNSFSTTNEYLIGYENCCSSTELTFYKKQLQNQLYNYGIKITFELKGLSSFGTPFSKQLQNKLRF